MDRRLSMREVADAVLSGIPGVPASAAVVEPTAEV